MLSAICKNADFDFDDADEDEYDPVLGNQKLLQNVLTLIKISKLLKIKNKL